MDPFYRQWKCRLNEGNPKRIPKLYTKLKIQEQNLYFIFHAKLFLEKSCSSTLHALSTNISNIKILSYNLMIWVDVHVVSNIALWCWQLVAYVLIHDKFKIITFSINSIIMIIARQLTIVKFSFATKLRYPLENAAAKLCTELCIKYF